LGSGELPRGGPRASVCCRLGRTHSAAETIRLAVYVGDRYISGAPDARWSDDDLRALARVTGRDLVVVRMEPLTTE
jgi:hypothetical protein